MKPNYYITGANGFIGQNLCKYLEGERIIKLPAAVDFDKPFIFINLAAYGNHYHQTSEAKIIQANITDLIKWRDFAKHDNLIKFYNISTSSVTLPFQTMYSASKLFGETLINNLGDERFINIRPYSVYGPGEADHRFIPTVIRCLKSGEEMRVDAKAQHDWIFVDDFITAMFNRHTEIGTGTQYSNLEVIRMLEAISNKQLNFKEVAALRAYDTYKWQCPKGVPHRHIYEGLKQAYESA